MPNEKTSEYPEAGELQPADLHDISVPGGGLTTESATQYQVTGGEQISKVFGDFSDASQQFDLVVFTLKGGRKFQEYVLKHEIEWSGPGITDVKIELGIVGNEGKYTFEPIDIDVAPGDDILVNEEPNTIEDFNNDVDIVMRITTQGANLDQLDTGSIDLYIFSKSMKP